MLSPPSAKKSSVAPILSTSRTSANTSAMTCSILDPGARNAVASNTGSGNALRSSLPLMLSGNASSTTKADGTIYAGTLRPSATATSPISRSAPGRATRYATRRRTHTLDCHEQPPPHHECHPSAAAPTRSRRARSGNHETSPGSPYDPDTRAHPSLVQRTRSPVRYIRSPDHPNGIATNRSAVRSGRAKYPRANCAPARYNSPGTPTGTGCRRASSTNTRVFHCRRHRSAPTPHRRRRQLVTGHRHRGLGRTVQIVQPRIVAGTEPLRRRRRQRLTDREHPPQTTTARTPSAVRQQHRQHRRHQMQRRHTAPTRSRPSRYAGSR